MNKKDAAKNILFSLDDINDVRRRIMGSEEIPELEIDMLRQQVLTLYQELNRYKRLSQEADGTPKAAAYTPPQAKAEPIVKSTTVEETKQAPKPENVQAYEPPKEQVPPQPSMVKETPEAENKKEKLTEAEPVIQPEPVKAEERPQAQPAMSTQDKIAQAYAQARTKEQEPKSEEKIEKQSSSINQQFQSTTAQSSINERFAQQNVKTKLADKLKLSPISDLSKALSINQRVSFVKELFKGDEKEFKRVVAYVNSLRNFSEAKFFLESEVARQYEWNEESPKMQEFMELVFRKFL